MTPQLHQPLSEHYTQNSHTPALSDPGRCQLLGLKTLPSDHFDTTCGAHYQFAGLFCQSTLEGVYFGHIFSGKVRLLKLAVRLNQLRIHRTFALFAIFIALFGLAPPRAYAGGALKLKMRHPGTSFCDIYISKRAFKLISLRNNYLVFAHAPDWKVTTVNPVTKLISEKPIDQWRAFISQLSDGWTIVSTPETVQRDVIFDGLPARMKSTPVKGRNLGWPKTFNAGPYVTEEAYYYKGTAIPHPVALILNQLFDQGTASDLVLALLLIDKHGHSLKQIWTESSASVDLPPEFFEPPRGMRQAALSQVFGNVAVPQSAIKDMIDGVGLGNDLGKGASKPPAK
jgi:hypothetical protein